MEITGEVLQKFGFFPQKYKSVNLVARMCLAQVWRIM